MVLTDRVRQGPDRRGRMSKHHVEFAVSDIINKSAMEGVKHELTYSLSEKLSGLFLKICLASAVGKVGE